MSDQECEVIELWGLPVRTTRHPDFRSSRLYVGPEESKSVLTHLKEIGRKMAAAEFGIVPLQNQVVTHSQGAIAGGTSQTPPVFVRGVPPVFDWGIG